MNLSNLFLGIAAEDIGSEGEVELIGAGKVKAKNLLDKDFEKGQQLVAVQCKKTQKYYIYASGD